MLGCDLYTGEYGTDRRVRQVIMRVGALPVGERELRHIASAIEMYSSGTCLRFEEVPIRQRVEEQHLLFTKTRSLG